MHYFKNHELASMYKVSQAAVGKWIAAAKKGKLTLTLIDDEGKPYIANTAKNLATIEEIVRDRRKYLNRRSLKTITPSPGFYKQYSKRHIYDVISNIEIHREIPHQYSYFNGGADYWEKYIHKLALEDTPNLFTSTINLLAINQPYLDKLLSKYKRINIIDIGVGDSYPAKDLISHYLARGVLDRYIALDISNEMLAKARHNIKEWFGNKVAFEGHNIDINYDRFVNITSQDSADDCANLVLFFGGTLSNLRSPQDALKVISSSLNPNDIFILSGIVDTPQTRLYFDFNLEPSSKAILPTHKMMLDLLRIEEQFYEVERLFDKELRARFMRIRLKVALSLQFELNNTLKRIDLNKGETLLNWRHWHYSVPEYVQNFDDCNFDLLHLSTTPSRDCVLLISQIKMGEHHRRP